MPQARRPKAPIAPRAPKLPPLSLQPMRPRRSVALDKARTKSGEDIPPFVRWPAFMAEFDWKQGEHITTIAPTGYGKTVLNRQLLLRRAYVLACGIKRRDPELYGPFEKQGYQLVRHFEPEVPDDADVYRLLFVPQTTLRGAEGRKKRAAAFRLAINDVMDVGRWCLYLDDVQYMADQLRLGPDLEEAWLNGRSEEVSVVASSQEPVNIPVMAYGMATHLFLFKNDDIRRAQRMAELTGVNREIAQRTILGMPKYEFLYINKATGRMVRSRVEQAR